MRYIIYVTLFSDRIITEKIIATSMPKLKAYCQDLMSKGIWEKGDNKTMILHKPKMIRIKEDT